MSRAVVLGLVIAGGALSAAVAAYQAQPQGPKVVEVEKLKDNLYMLKGGGGNTAVFVGTAGVVVVDTKNPGWGQPILDKIKEITDKPITTIVNTHTHGDHTGSNNMFPASVEIIAHENTKANMEKMDAFKGEGAKGLPKKTYQDKMSLGSGKDRVDLFYFGRGHTNGDTWIVYPSVRVMQTDDMFAWKDAPLLDKNNGGSGVEYADTVRKAVAAANNVDQLIVGHSPLRTVADLKEYAAFMDDLVAAVKQAKAAGKNAKDAAAEIDLTTKYKGYKKERQEAAVQVIFDELK